VEELKKDKQISEETISFYLDSEKGKSYADFGKYDINSVKNADEDNITWVPMPK
jgi:hypothetical protein